MYTDSTKHLTMTSYSLRTPGMLSSTAAVSQSVSQSGGILNLIAIQPVSVAFLGWFSATSQEVPDAPDSDIYVHCRACYCTVDNV
jgi:hypothetical protein